MLSQNEKQFSTTVLPQSKTLFFIGKIINVFRYARVELLIAFGNIAFIWVVTGALLFEACKRVKNLDSFEVQGRPIVIMASLAIVFNLM